MQRYINISITDTRENSIAKKNVSKRIENRKKSWKNRVPQAHQQGILIRNIDFPVFFKWAWSPGCAKHRVTVLKVCVTIGMLHMLCVWGIRLLKVGNWGGGFYYVRERETGDAIGLL